MQLLTAVADVMESVSLPRTALGEEMRSLSLLKGNRGHK